MRRLPHRPDLDQLRLQAQELQRSEPGLTLSAAQTRLAREYGFASWPKLKATVAALSYRLRSITSVEELDEVYDLLGALYSPPVDRHRNHAVHHRRLAQRFPDDAALMLVAEQRGLAVAGLLCGRQQDAPTQATIFLIGVLPGHRGRGLARRLLERVESTARRLGVSELSEWTRDAEQRSFWAHMGFRVGIGRDGSIHKSIPPTLDQLRLRRLERREVAP